MKKTYYITTPIYYPSGTWHLGTCYTSVVCDALARFKKMEGYDTFFLTGTDEHGQKIEKAAQADGLTNVQEYIDGKVALLKKVWELLGIKYDKFIRTTDDYHKVAVQKIFTKLYEKGDIYKSNYEGHYCRPCEAFWTESQLVDGKCPDCGRATEIEKEECYFFRLSKYQKQLEDLLNENPDFLLPVSRRNEMINNFLRPGLQDVCVSRATSKWGIEVPFDKNHIIYVWIDALTNYITALGYESSDDSLFKKYWPADLHMVGKEIVRFHALIWPALLMALDIPLPKKIFGHGWIYFGDEKMSKSKGNIVDPFVLTAKYGVDSVRYYLLRDIIFGNDTNYSLETFLSRRNAELCNGLGNLMSRTAMMIHKYFCGICPQPTTPGYFDDDLIKTANSVYDKVKNHIDQLAIHEAIAEIWKLVNRANKYIDETTPWILAKDPNSNGRLSSVLYNLAESLRLIAVLLKPFLIETPEKILASLSCTSPKLFKDAVKFGGLTPGSEVKIIDKLFDRIDIEAEIIKVKLELNMEHNESSQIDTNTKTETPAAKPLINYDEFTKMDLRAGIIKSAEAVKKSQKLLKLSVDIGYETRTIVSGIAKYYTPEELLNKCVTVIVNLTPTKLCGILSEGMLLCAQNSSGNVVLISPEKPVEGGSPIS
ncbi:MAG: methionine--tRNA ligase [Christensenellaceae bacterium]|jgi:methionyl-tRNA synthetase|nr:methionine--tRNA ligase [Christensenellaceae bacterium]